MLIQCLYWLFKVYSIISTFSLLQLKALFLNNKFSTFGEIYGAWSDAVAVGAAFFGAVLSGAGLFGAV